jgi:hypothetical protein
MNAAIKEKFGEIEQFNTYVREHPEVLSTTMPDGASVDDLRVAANRLGFAISTDQVTAYIEEKFGSARMREEHFTVSADIFCDSTVSITTTAAVGTTVAVANTVALGEVGVYAIVDIVVAAVVVAWAVVGL